MKRRWWRWIGIAAMLLSGCQTTAPSLNVQRSILRDAGDTSATVVLEKFEEEVVETVAKRTEKICGQVLTFLETGNVGALTKDQLQEDLKELLPVGTGDFLVTLLELVNVDVGAIGSDNVKRVRAFVLGVAQGSKEYAVEDRD